MKCEKNIRSVKDSTKNCDRLSATNNVSTTFTESEDTVEKSTQNQDLNQSSNFLLSVHNDTKRHRSIFQTHVHSMHINFWRKRPQLLHSSIHLENHTKGNYLQDLMQPSNKVKNYLSISSTSISKNASSLNQLCSTS